MTKHKIFNEIKKEWSGSSASSLIVDISAQKRRYSICNYKVELRSFHIIAVFHTDKVIFMYVSHQLPEVLPLCREGRLMQKV